MKYRDHVKTARGLNRMFNDKELSFLPTTSSINDNLDDLKMVELDNISERDKLDDLLDYVPYYDEVLAQYGYDVEEEEWNVREFPITRNDKQMDGIKSDIQKAGEAADEYNDYLEYLSERYGRDVDNIGKHVFVSPLRKKVHFI
jgi:hypothetical protein